MNIDCICHISVFRIPTLPHSATVALDDEISQDFCGELMGLIYKAWVEFHKMILAFTPWLPSMEWVYI